MIDGTVLESLRCLPLVPDKSHGKNELATLGGTVLAVSTSPQEAAEAPATSYKRRPAR